MIIQQLFIGGIAHSSYIVAGNETCAVIDPPRDVERYREAAAELGVRITHILTTHLHADFVSGHLELARLTGARIYAPASASCEFDHQPLSGGDTVALEDIRFRVIETPGHTPADISYVASDLGRGEDPAAVFCGDTLFVGDVGRPDLFPGRAEELGSALYDSLHQKLLRLPDHCEVYPAHGAGSLCGRAMAAKRSSTIGYERAHNPALQIPDRADFVRSLTSDMPAAPDHFGRCSEINRRGPALLASLPAPAAFSPKAFSEEAAREETVVLDLRSYDAFGGMHVPNSYHIDISANFSTMAGWVLPPDRDILLVTADPGQVKAAMIGLYRVGLDRIRGYLEGGMRAWSMTGLPIDRIPIISPEEAHTRVHGDDRATLVDVRSKEDYAVDHAAGAINIPAPDLRSRFGEVPDDRAAIMICAGGVRASLAGSILKMRGHPAVYNVAGGIRGYRAAGLPISRDVPAA